MKAYFLLAFVCVYACDKTKKHPVKDSEPTAVTRELAVHFQEKLAAYPPGWPSTTDCDATLWAGLALAAGAPVDLSEAEYPVAGHIQRRPAPTCWDGNDKGAPSTVSRDMLTGYLWGAWASKDTAAIDRLDQYGKSHNWVMGEGDATRTGMGQNLTGLVCRMVGGSNCIGSLFFPVNTDWEHHVQVLDILLQAGVSGGVDGLTLDRVREAVAFNPNDATAQATLGVFTGDYETAASLLNDPDYRAPSYVRGAGGYELVHWLFAASIVLKHQKVEP